MPSRRIVESWLKELIDYDLLPAELSDRLIDLGIEVESVEDRRALLNGFIVAEVLARNPHENADKLSVCSVFTGSGDPVTVVCGAPNVAAGQKVAFAPVGTTMAGGEFTIEKRKIRGVVSEGMICSEQELGIGESHEGILVLPPDAVPGTPLADVLGDVVFDVDITANRGDCLSHLGIAREIRAVTGNPIRLPQAHPAESGERTDEHVSVRIHSPELCPRYAARIVRGITLGPSPKWLQDRLTMLGIKPRNNVVDIASYVMFETGHPLHAFDYDLVKGRRIEVRTAEGGEKFATLDGKERVLPKDALLICDGERPVAIAGVMGGANSEINDGTVNVLIESAYFNPSSIRRTAKQLDLSTDASYRFERGGDIGIVEYAVDRAASLMAEIAGGEVLAGIVDEYPLPRDPLTIELRFARTNAIIGIDIEPDRQLELLRRLGFTIDEVTAEYAIVKQPTWRSDVEQEIDLIEEIARLNGLGQIPADTRGAVSFSTAEDPLLALGRRTREFFVANGFMEIVAPHMTDPEAATRYGKPLEIMNPLGLETSMLRTNLLPGLGRIVAYNERRSRFDLRFFEIGKVFREGRGDQGVIPGIVEVEELAVLMSGRAEPVAWDQKERDSDIYDLRGAIDRYLSFVGVRNVEYRPVDEERWGIAAPALALFAGGVEVGRLGSLDGWIRERYDVSRHPVVLLLDVARLLRAASEPARYVAPSRFPAIERDLSLLVDRGVPNAELESTVRGAGSELLRSARLFDLYEGKGIEQGKKSMTYSLVFAAPDRTLEDQIVDDLVKGIIDRVGEEHGATLRG